MTTGTVSSLPAGTQFGRSLCVLGAGRGDLMIAEANGLARGWPAVAAVFKSLQTALTPSELGDAWLLIANDLAAALRPLAIVTRLPLVRRGPLNTRLISQSQGATASFVTAGQAIPIATPIMVSPMVPITAKKVATVILQTAELLSAQVPGAGELIQSDAIAAVALAIDQAFVGSQSETEAAPGGIAYGATSYTSSGGTALDIDADLKRLIDVLVAGGNSLQSAMFIVHPTSATHLALLRNGDGSPAYPGFSAKGGTLAGLPAITSAAMVSTSSPSEHSIVLLEQSEILVCDDGRLDIAITKEAVVQTNNPVSTGAQPGLSLWQNDLAALRIERFLNWRVRRPGAVAVLTDCQF